MIKIAKIFPIVFLTLAVIPLSCQAFFLDELFEDLEEWFSEEISNSSQIINKIEVSTNTGQTTINGEVKEGETKSKVYVKNIINGKEIDSIDIESDKNEVKVESKIEVNEGKALVQRKIEIDSEKTVENYEVNLENSESDIGESTTEGESEIENEEEAKEILDTIHGWWSKFLDNLVTSLQNIFSIFNR